MVHPAAEQPSEKREYLTAMNGLRLFAALHLLSFHLYQSHALDPFGLPALARAFMQAGKTNTSLFIVLSGFVLYYSAVDPARGLRMPARRFWVARFAQTYPLMMIGHLLAAPAALLGTTSYGGAEAVGRALLVATATQSWVPPLAFSFDEPAWTISSLALCYALFPILSRWVRGLGPRQCAAALAATWPLAIAPATLCLALVPGAADVQGTDPSNLWAITLHVFPPLLLPIFVSGMLLSRLFVEHGWARRANGAVLSLGALAGIVAGAAAGDHIPYLLIRGGILLPLHWMLIVGLATGRGPLARLLGSRPLASLTGASVAIYLLHHPMLDWLLVFLGRFWAGRSPLLPVLAYVGGTCILSVLASRRVAAPLSRWIRGRWGARPSPARDAAAARVPVAGASVP